MEIKSNNVLIGTFTLIVVFGVFLFVMWLSRVQVNQQYDEYEIVFDGSVSGLSVGGSVQYNGLPVGTVRDLHLMENNPNKVVALVRVDARTPVKEDSIAQLELAGITGVAFIQLSGGSPNSPPLEAKGDQYYPVIKAEQSTLQEIATAAPKTLQKIDKLVSSLRDIVDENRASVKGTLQNLEKMSKVMADGSSDMKKAITELSEASVHLNNISRNADNLVAGDGKQLVAEARKAVESYRKVGEQLDRMMEASGPAVSDGMQQLPQLIAETRSLITSLNGIANRAQDDPARYIIGNRVPEVEAK
ncbi:phospholipid/cholesterol/gamma-HCH transport system substrate-binding protein [Parvibaculum indicum]|uniref:MlaD family protein n=1 Tax=Parvibaculum indicum TaxID=562969 RepID=UPI0014228994|nr:MlaD family protein [Parvibaculum indicum]NIJ41089.1 phospholipid/cholesterol/gamma-HCH transport system substrate-binding protein [Parvibaculum indicum]